MKWQVTVSVSFTTFLCLFLGQYQAVQYVFLVHVASWVALLFFCRSILTRGCCCDPVNRAAACDAGIHAQLVCVPAASFPTCPATVTSGKAAADGSVTEAPAIHMADTNDISASWFQPDPSHYDIWGVNPQIKGYMFKGVFTFIVFQVDKNTLWKTVLAMLELSF